MDRLNVGHCDYGIGLEHIQTHTRHTGVGLVVDEQIAPIVTTIGVTDMRVVSITIKVLGTVTENTLGLVGMAITGRRAVIEHRDTHDFAHGGHTVDAHLTTLTTTPETVILVEFTRSHVDISGTTVGLCLGRLAMREGTPARHAGGTRHTRRTHCGTTGQETAASLVDGSGELIACLLVAHDASPLTCLALPTLRSAILTLHRLLLPPARSFHRPWGQLSAICSHLNSRNSLVLVCLATQACRLLALFALHHHGRTLAVVVVGDLAVQAVVAFVGIDVSLGMNRLDMTLVGTDLAGLAALFMPTQPVEQTNPRRKRQTGTQRAHIAAVEFVVEGADH